MMGRSAVKCEEGCHEGIPPTSGHKAGGTHPTGMLPCYDI